MATIPIQVPALWKAYMVASPSPITLSSKVLRRKNQSRKKRTDGLRRRVSSRISKGSFDKEPVTLDVLDCSSITNPAIHGGIESAWFDSVAVFDFDCFDD
ncbi:plant/F14N23-31 protein [Senna tora]|uniref:Plant/F14N23-31 protein n=1 Tax=Senna tora TaxID=362788 RepID=A0A835CDT7_9FABA|nr:plant/F14N23-31 protein [Senna tora]